MPFADEIRPVEVVEYRPAWQTEFVELAARLSSALGELALAIDHIGSTSVLGLATKDVIDIQVRVETLDREAIIQRFGTIGFRRRPEEWNSVEVSFGETCGKLVFAPPAGERASNVHVRVQGSANARFALLFRDFLRSNDEARDDWSEFKMRVVSDLQRPDLAAYGQMKAPATEALMLVASTWADATGWEPS